MRNKDFKNGGQAGSRGGCLKKGGLESPSNYDRQKLKFIKFYSHSSSSYEKNLKSISVRERNSGGKVSKWCKVITCIFI